MSEAKQFPTLSEYFETSFRPIRLVAKGRDEKTIRSYEESMKLWRKLTPNKPIDQITDLDVAQFLIDLGKHRGKKPGSTMKRSSVSKHAVQLQTVLQSAGPKSSHNRRGKNLIPEPPYFDAPKADKTPPRSNWTLPEMRAKDSWLTVPNEISKGGKGSRHFVHPEAMEHFEKIRVDGRDEILMYPAWERGRRLLYDYLRGVQRFANISKERRYGFHSFRKTHTTVLASLTLESNAGIEIASRSANHADKSITTDFYISADVQERLLEQAILRMPSPCVKSIVVEAVETKVEVRSMKRIVSRAVEHERDFID